MTEFERQFREVKELLDFKDYSKVIKRIIDFTLDTEDIRHYQKTNAFLNWHDSNENNDVEKIQRDCKHFEKGGNQHRDPRYFHYYFLFSSIKFPNYAGKIHFLLLRGL